MIFQKLHSVAFAKYDDSPCDTRNRIEGGSLWPLKKINQIYETQRKVNYIIPLCTCCRTHCEVSLFLISRFLQHSFLHQTAEN